MNKKDTICQFWYTMIEIVLIFEYKVTTIYISIKYPLCGILYQHQTSIIKTSAFVLSLCDPVKHVFDCVNIF